MNFKANFIFSICLAMANIDNLTAFPRFSPDSPAPKVSNISTNQDVYNSCACSSDYDAKHRKPKKKVAKLGVDKAGNPINIVYVTQGKKRRNRPTILLMDGYFGKNGWKCTQQALSKYFYTIAIDPLGGGESTSNKPTDVDGVDFGLGVPDVRGYSFDYFALATRKFLEVVGVDSPVIAVATDTQGEVAIKYQVRYENDPLAFSKLVLVNVSAQSVVSDDPCQLAYVNTQTAQYLVGLFKEDKCKALCLFLSTSFTDPACPKMAKEVYKDAVNYASGSADVFERIMLKTLTEDISPLLVKINIPVLYLYSVVDPDDLVSRKAQGLFFTGYCPTCSNPTNPNKCTSTKSVEPVRDIQLRTFAGKGTACWRTDYKRFNESVFEFIKGYDLACQPCPINAKIPKACPTCS